MNYVYDLLRSWADKLTYRILQLSGASKEALSKFVKARIEAKQDIIDTDQKLTAKLKIATIIKWILVAVIAFFAYRIVKLIKDK